MLLRGLWIVIFSFVFFFANLGCYGPQDQFIVLRDVPESPSFVVIPTNNYLSQVMFANEVEAAIIGAGVKVVSRPATKEITKEVAAEGGMLAIEGAQAAHKSGEGKLIERYVAFDDINADYIVKTYVSQRQIRIMKNQTREVLAVLNLKAYTDQKTGKRVSYSELVADALANMGIPVIHARKQGPATSRPKRKSP